MEIIKAYEIFQSHGFNSSSMVKRGGNLSVHCILREEGNPNLPEGYTYRQLNFLSKLIANRQNEVAVGGKKESDSTRKRGESASSIRVRVLDLVEATGDAIVRSIKMR